MDAILTLVFIFSTAHAGVSCDAKSICKMGSSEERTTDRTVNGRVVRGRPADDQVRKEREGCHKNICSYKEPARMNELYEQVVKRIPTAITRGRPEFALNAAEKSVINAFKGIKLLDPVENPKCKKYCGSGGYAKKLDDGVCVCPWMESLTDETLIFVMAHELGHAADICSTKETGFKPGQHPFEIPGPGGSVLSCLQENGINGRTEKEQQIYNRNSARVASEIAGINPDSKTGKVFGTIFSPLPKLMQPSDGSVHCRGPLGHSHMQEASADIFGFETVADFLRDYPLKPGDATNVKRMFSLFLDGCDKKVEDGDLDHHAGDADRMNKIALSLPSVREALGCEAHSPHSCDYRAATPAATGAPSTAK